MGDPLLSQKRVSCKLELPDGLQELMSDISREVLRAQPLDLYNFITNYLSVMLVTRENLSIAAHLCDDVCTDACYQELEDELRFIGFDEEETNKLKAIIIKYFEKCGTNKENLVMTLLKNTNMNETEIEAVNELVQRAFKRHLVNNTILYESSSGSDLDEVTRAAKHTLQLYRKTNLPNNEYQQTNYRVKVRKCENEFNKRIQKQP